MLYKRSIQRRIQDRVTPAKQSNTIQYRFIHHTKQVHLSTQPHQRQRGRPTRGTMHQDTTTRKQEPHNQLQPTGTRATQRPLPTPRGQRHISRLPTTSQPRHLRRPLLHSRNRKLRAQRQGPQTSQSNTRSNQSKNRGLRGTLQTFKQKTTTSNSHPHPTRQPTNTTNQQTCQRPQPHSNQKRRTTFQKSHLPQLHHNSIRTRRHPRERPSNPHRPLLTKRGPQDKPRNKVKLVLKV